MLRAIREDNRGNIANIAYNDAHVSLEDAFRRRVHYNGLPFFPLLLQTERIQAGLDLLRNLVDEENDALKVPASQVIAQIQLLGWAVAGIDMAFEAAHDSAESVK